MTPWFKRLAIALIHGYRWTLSPLMGNACRFEPSCSRYAEQCIEEWGVLRGTWLGIKRIARCHPWSKGGVDAPPSRSQTVMVIGLIALTTLPAFSESQSGPQIAAQTGFTLRTPFFETELVPAQGGAAARFNLLEKQFKTNGQPLNAISTSRPEYRPLQLLTWVNEKRVEPQWSIKTSAEDHLIVEGSSPGVIWHRRIQPGRSPYTLWSTLVVKNISSATLSAQTAVRMFHYVRRDEEKGGFLGAPAHGLSHGLCSQTAADKSSVERLTREDIGAAKTLPRKTTHLLAVENLYFVNAVAASLSPASTCTFTISDRGGTPGSPEGSLFEGDLVYAPITLQPGQSTTYRDLIYMGPKRHQTLNAAGHHMGDAVDLGFFSVIARSLVGLLSAIHKVVPNWGLAIIVLTLLVKLLLYPLTEKSFKSMARMRNLKPELDRINAMYGDDRQKKGAATMELYRKNGINPMGGCLPQLLQLPIWWALYTSLSTNVELFHAPFLLWWQDLSSRDPYYVLPLILGGLMFVQQKLTPNTTMDPVQAKMMAVMMPIMMTAFMLFLPAGLCIYMVTNSVLGIAQQKMIDWRLQKRSTP